MDKKTEGQRVWIHGDMRVQLQGCWDAKPESFPTNAPSTPFDNPLGPGGSWINPFPPLVLSSLMCKMGGAAVGDIIKCLITGGGETQDIATFCSCPGVTGAPVNILKTFICPSTRLLPVTSPYNPVWAVASSAWWGLPGQGGTHLLAWKAASLPCFPHGGTHDTWRPKASFDPGTPSNL